MVTKFDRIIEHIISGNEKAARRAFHEVVVEKSRKIYESLEMDGEEEHEHRGLLDEVDFEETSGINEVGGDESDDFASDVVDPEVEQPMAGAEDDEFASDDEEMASDEDEFSDENEFGAEEEFDGEEEVGDGEEEVSGEEIEDRFVDLEDALAELQAEFAKECGKDSESDEEDGDDEFEEDESEEEDEPEEDESVG
jgi:hypothetical protein